MQLDLFKIPKSTAIGTSVLLMEIDEASAYFPGRNHQALCFLFRDLNIPIFYGLKSKRYFNLYTLEKVIHHLLKVGGTGFASGGSAYRILHRIANSPVPQRVSKELTHKLAEEDCALVPHPKRHRGRPTLDDYAEEKAAITKSKEKTKRSHHKKREPVTS